MICNRFSEVAIELKLLLTFLSLCSLFQKGLATNKIVADVASDLRFSWKVTGEYIYVPAGEQLPEFSNILPSNFPFESVSNSLGIWVILPRLAPISTINNVTLWTNKVSFSYSTSAQLLDSVTVKHNSGGHSIINIIANKQNYTQTPEAMFPHWMDVTVPLEGTNKFTIEATAMMEHDYILIDRIEARFLEIRTSTRRPRSSTIAPLPLSGQQSLHGSLSCIILAFGLSYIMRY